MAMFQSMTTSARAPTVASPRKKAPTRTRRNAGRMPHLQGCARAGERTGISLSMIVMAGAQPGSGHSIVRTKSFVWRAAPGFDPEPADRAGQGDKRAESDSPHPPQFRAHPGSDHRREQADAVAARVHNGGRGATACSTEFDRCCPKCPFAQSEDAEREREPEHNPERLRGEDAEQQQHRARSHSNTRNQRSAGSWAALFLRLVREPAAERHADCHREVGYAGVEAAFGLAHVNHFVEVVVHPVKEQVLEVADGRVAQCQQQQVPVSEEATEALWNRGRVSCGSEGPRSGESNLALQARTV